MGGHAPGGGAVQMGAMVGDGVIDGGYRHDDGAAGGWGDCGWVVEAVHPADGSEEARLDACDFVADIDMTATSTTAHTAG